MQVTLPSIREGSNQEQQMSFLTDSYNKLKKELTFLLQNLDSDNVIEARSVIADWVYAGGIVADQITTGTLDASTVSVININADNIETGTLNAISITSCTITGGTINIDTDAVVGNKLQLGSPLDSSNKEIDFGSAISIYTGSSGYNLYFFNNVVNGEIWIESDYLNFIVPGEVNFTSPHIYWNTHELATQDWVTSQGYITGVSGATGSFTTVDSKTVSVSNGLITAIT
jgi:phage tail tube protein FII